MGRACRALGMQCGCIQGFVGKAEGKGPRRWEDNIKMDLM
jgi:hypothetical protein